MKAYQVIGTVNGWAIQYLGPDHDPASRFFDILLKEMTEGEIQFTDPNGIILSKAWVPTKEERAEFSGDAK